MSTTSMSAMKAATPWRPVYSLKKGTVRRSAQETAQRTWREKWAMGAMMSPRPSASWMWRTVSTGESAEGAGTGAAPVSSRASTATMVGGAGVRGYGARDMSAGPVALVGSGEFLEAMTAVDTGLLAGR